MPGGEIEYRDGARHVKVAEDALEMVGWGCGFVDLDLDGRQDLVVVNGSTSAATPPSCSSAWANRSRPTAYA